MRNEKKKYWQKGRRERTLKGCPVANLHSDTCFFLCVCYRNGLCNYEIFSDRRNTQATFIVESTLVVLKRSFISFHTKKI